MNFIKEIFIKNPFKNKDNDSDFVITVEGLILNVHSFLLSNNSPVFADVIANNVNQWNITNSKAQHVIEFLKFFYVEYEMEITDNTAFHGILPLSKEFQTVWLSNRISDFFLNKSSMELEEFGLDVIYYADQFDLDMLQHKLLNNINFTFPFTEQVIKKQNYIALTNKTKFGLARKRLAKILQIVGKDDFRITEINSIFDNIQEQKKPPIRETPPFQFVNIFKEDKQNSDVAVIIRGHRFYLHRWILRRNSPKFKQLLKPAEEHLNLYELKLGDGFDEKAFLLMVQNFYPKYQFQISEQHPIKSLYKICTYFEVEQMKKIILRRVDEMTDYTNISSRLKTLQLVDEVNAQELRDKLLESLKEESYFDLVQDPYYKYLNYTTRFSLVRTKIRAPETFDFFYSDMMSYDELCRIFEELDKIVLHYPESIGNDVLHNAHCQGQ